VASGLRSCECKHANRLEGHEPSLTFSCSGSGVAANSFVETALSYALTYITRFAHQPQAHTIRPAKLTILADNDYYSQPTERTTTSVLSDLQRTASPSSFSSEGTPPASHINAAHAQSSSGGFSSKSRYAKFPTTLPNAHKTGLGSSAALVTALTAAVLTHYLDRNIFDLSTSMGRQTLHNLAQAAHCAAQGKIGSGFDVAAAVYGSSLYRRFSPSVLDGLVSPGKPGFAADLERVVGGKHTKAVWDVEIAKDAVHLPEGVAVRMLDVDCGSQTVSMVKSVLAWRSQQHAAAKELWDELQHRDERLAEILKTGKVAEIREATRRIRELVRKMGKESGVAIEPESQTKLLDALEDVQGVYGGVVPGAGGFDALAIMMNDDTETEKRVAQFADTWSKGQGVTVRLLDVKGEMEGVRVENVAEIQEWL
jgi:phosphomevalonate kinase